MEKVRVIVIDDSAFNRETIVDILRTHPDVEVIGTAEDGEKGLKLVMSLEPDLVTLDLEMPRMDGFTFLRVLMAQKPMPVIVVSSHDRPNDVFRALELGALDFISKPSHFFPEEVDLLRGEILSKVLAARASVLGSQVWRPKQMPPAVAAKLHGIAHPSDGVRRLVCVGASTGGPQALQALFQGLPGGGGASFLVAQHMPASFTHAFAERLNRIVSLKVLEAEHGVELQPGAVYIAPGGKNLELVVGKDGALRLEVGPARAKEAYLPSIDRLFGSVAERYTGPILAAVLTGMGADGAEGVRKISEAGGKVIAESEESAVVFGMPQAAIDTGCVDEVLSLVELIDRVLQYSTKQETQED